MGSSLHTFNQYYAQSIDVNLKRSSSRLHLQSLSLFDLARVQITVQIIQLRLFTLWVTGKNKLASFSHSEIASR
jgi:hypothetical protein